eukprot:gene2262-2477_t
MGNPAVINLNADVVNVARETRRTSPSDYHRGVSTAQCDRKGCKVWGYRFIELEKQLGGQEDQHHIAPTPNKKIRKPVVGINQGKLGGRE